MQFRIADTFTDSLQKLDGNGQKAVKTTAFDLQMNPAHPGMKFHKVDRARDSNFWSVRVSRDIRLIVHKTASSLLLCYVDHHDKAYQWAERRKIETHPNTGAAQIVEVRETVREITVPRYVEIEQIEPEKPKLFTDIPAVDLLGYGVPEEWIEDVRHVNEDTLFDLTDHLPAEASEALLELAVGGTPHFMATPDAPADPFDHPDAQRRFRVVQGVDALALALDYPWDKWTVFLHPAQRELVAREFNGPARVSGSAGTGKTIVALHRAVHLARTHDDSRVLLTTFNETLANALRSKLKRLTARQPQLAERIEVGAIDRISRELYQRHVAVPRIASADEIRMALDEAAAAHDASSFSPWFLESEWREVVDAWQIGDWPAYRDVKRLGRKTRLPESQRETLWQIFSGVRSRLTAAGLTTMASVYGELSQVLGKRRHPVYDFVVVDEAQDISVPQLRFLAALSPDHPNALFFAGDLGQRIFQTPYSWKSLGVDIRGRSRTLKVNYRTSHQIRTYADRLLDSSLDDVDGNRDDRSGTVSLFNGPSPSIRICGDETEEINAVAEWLSRQVSDAADLHEIGVIVRSDRELSRARNAIKAAGFDGQLLDTNLGIKTGTMSLATMDLAKGLEFRAAVVMACDDEVVPSQARLESVGDPSDLEEIYNTERHLLYVACTRARDALMISAVDPASEFLDDLALP